MPRQLYGLGSLVKSITKPIKKVAKGIKSFAKSDIGKLALTAGALYGLGGGTFFGRALPGLSTSGGFAFSNIAPNLFGVKGVAEAGGSQGILSALGLTKGYGEGLTGFGKIAALTIPSVLAAAGVQDEQEMESLKQNPEQLKKLLERGYRNLNPNAEEKDVIQFVRDNSADGGRIGYKEGTDKEGIMKMAGYLDPMSEKNDMAIEMFGKQLKDLTEDELDILDEEIQRLRSKFMAEGGRIGHAMGTDNPERNAMQASGVEGLPLNKNPAGVTELDLRETGGFIPPVGVKEKADDIPAMLSNNEFVFTADAVRGMGDGDVDKGAERMYSMMKTLENGGRV